MKQINWMVVIISVLGSAIGPAAAFAEITFIKATIDGVSGIEGVRDAIPTNTALANGDPLVLSTHYLLDTNSTTGLWNYRTTTPHDNDGDYRIFNSNNSGGNNNAPRMRTTITGLEIGKSYSIYVYFFSNFGTANWSVRAGFEDTVEDLQLFGRIQVPETDVDYPVTLGTSMHADYNNMPNLPLGMPLTLSAAGAGTGLFQGNVGVAVAADAGDGTGKVVVYIDDFVTNLSTRRNFYTGVGFGPPPIPGDFDSDGDVDGADFGAWQTSFPSDSGATLIQGDADGDGDVDGADYIVWQTNFPFSPQSPAILTPEPYSISLILLGGTVMLSQRRKLVPIPRC